MIPIKLLSLVIVACICGCSSRYPITYSSEPQGASLTCGGINYGYTPLTLTYKKPKSGTEIFHVEACQAQWSSGASKAYSGAYSFEKFPNGVDVTIRRPNVPGHQQDAEFALKVEQMHDQKRAADAAEYSASRIESLNTKVDSMINKSYTCKPDAFGGITCY